MSKKLNSYARVFVLCEAFQSSLTYAAIKEGIRTNAPERHSRSNLTYKYVTRLQSFIMDKRSSLYDRSSNREKSFIIPKPDCSGKTGRVRHTQVRGSHITTQGKYNLGTVGSKVVGRSKF